MSTTFTFKPFYSNMSQNGNLKEVEISRFTTAHTNFHADGQDAYVIYYNGRPNSIEFEWSWPHPGATLEESAQNHINALIAEQERP